MGSGLPQFGFPLRFAMLFFVPQKGVGLPACNLGRLVGVLAALRRLYGSILGIFSSKINSKRLQFETFLPSELCISGPNQVTHT